MKTTITLALAVAMVTGALQARTWTSSDGTKTFKGDYVSHTDDIVTVKKGFKNVRFKISLLSEDDRKWLAEQKAKADEKNKPEPKEADQGKIGNKLAGNLVKLTGGKYENYTQTSAPEYYLVYFTASW